MSAKPKISPVRAKNTTIAPPRRIRHGAEAWTDNTEQLFQLHYEDHENPDWLVGAS